MAKKKSQVPVKLKEESDFSTRALVSGIDVLRGTQLIKPEDFEFLNERVEQYEKRFRTRGIYRSRTEMVAGVLNDSEHPTVDSKYWQAIGEQNVHITELINLSYESKKIEADNDLLEAEIEELEGTIFNESSKIETKKLNAKLKKKKVELAQSQFGMTQMQKTAQERLREIKTWDEIIAQLEPNLEFGSEDFELHHPKRYYLRYAGRMQNFDQLEASAKESVLTHFKAFTKMTQDGGSPLPAELSMQEKTRELESKQRNIPPGFEESAEVDIDGGIENLYKSDPIAKKYMEKKTKRILVGTPHRRKEDTNCTNLYALQMPAGYSSDLDQPYGYTTSDAQNFLVNKAINENYNYLMLIEDDNIVPKNAVVKLLQHFIDDVNVAMAGGIYYRKYIPLETAGMHYDKDGNPSSIKHEIGDIIHNTLVLSMGCTLIKVSALKQLEYPYFKAINMDERPVITSDTYICEKFREIGMDIITDCGVQCLHVDREKGIIYGHKDIIDYKKNEVRVEWRDYFAV